MVLTALTVHTSTVTQHAVCSGAKNIIYCSIHSLLCLAVVQTAQCTQMYIYIICSLPAAVYNFISKHIKLHINKSMTVGYKPCKCDDCKIPLWTAICWGIIVILNAQFLVRIKARGHETSEKCFLWRRHQITSKASNIVTKSTYNTLKSQWQQQQNGVQLHVCLV